MRIREIKIENFKSFKKISIPNLLNVNMVYGYNNSGKSNLLKFLQLVFSTVEYEESIPVEKSGIRSFETQIKKQEFWRKTILNQPFIFRKEKEKMYDISFSITIELDIQYLEKNLSSFINFQKEYFKKGNNVVEIVYSGIIEKVSNYQAQQKTTDISLNGKNIFLLDDSGSPKTFDGSKILNFSDFESLMTLFNDCILLLDNDRYFINETEQNNNDAISAKNFKNKMFGLSLEFIKETEYEGLNNFLKSFLITSTDSVFNNNEKSSPFKNFKFEFIRVGNQIEILLANDFGKFPLSNFGTGVQQIIFILSNIFLANKKIILIEEIELNLSPKYQKELIDFIFSKLINGNMIINQLFYSTHSPLMCYRTEFRTLQSRIDANGISTIESITPKKTDIEKFVEVIKLLEHYHPPVVKKVPVKKDAIKASIQRSKARKEKTQK